MLEDFKILLARIDEADTHLTQARNKHSLAISDLNEQALVYVQLHVDSDIKEVYIDPSFWGWDCPTSPFNKCVYNSVDDPCLDDCLFCHQPYERK